MPYPFQNNLRHLEPNVAYECLLGLIDARGAAPGADFATWMLGTFGDGITKHFMLPYNRKVWATPAEEMSSTWIAERVSIVDYRRALQNLVLGRDDVGWGPNSTFAFPRVGGTGKIYRRLASRLGKRVHFERDLVELDAERLELRFADGTVEHADAVVSTAPINVLVETLTSCPAEVREAAGALRWTSVQVVGVGYEEPLQDDRSWLYFQATRRPSPCNELREVLALQRSVCRGRPHCSYLTETAHPPAEVPDGAELRRRVLDGLVATGLVDVGHRVASTHTIAVDYAYPVPTLQRDGALATIQSWLQQHNIFSRGRFGSWRYEIGNMDHAVKMGIDLARLLVEGRPEELWTP